jgi:hypothetical protein
VQAQFWSQLLRHIQESAAPAVSIRQQMLEICDHISMFAGLMTAHTKNMGSYHHRSVENLLILYISQRDLLNDLLEHGESGDGIFVLETSVKKLWDSDTATLVVKQGQHKQNYGMKYCGFDSRLVITPLTDRFYLAVQNVIHAGGLCCITGDGLGKQYLTASLAQELGFDVVPIDCRAIGTVDALTRVVRANLGSGFWANYRNISDIDPGFLGAFLTVFSAVHLALANQEPVMYIADQRVDIVDRVLARPKICMFFKSLALDGHGGCIFPPSVRRQFRVICYTPPDRNTVLSILLSANNFVDVAASATRLEALCDYVIQYKLCPAKVFLKFVYQSIPLAKTNYLHSTASPSMQLGLFAKLLISRLPLCFQDAIREEDLRYICNMFLEVIYSRENDEKDFRPSNSVAESANSLYKHIRRDSGCQSVIVVGPAAVGKSTLIKEIAGNAISDHNAELVQAAETADRSVHAHGTTAAAPTRAPRPLLRMKWYEHELNIFAMTHLPSCSLANGGHIESARVKQAAGATLEQAIRRLDTEQRLVVHLDSHSSLQLATLLPHATHLARYYSRPVKFIWECTELCHLDPPTVMSVPIVTIKTHIYDADDVISYQLNLMSAR